jgi:hypothetical protein
MERNMVKKLFPLINGHFQEAYDVIANIVIICIPITSRIAENLLKSDRIISCDIDNKSMKRYHRPRMTLVQKQAALAEHYRLNYLIEFIEVNIPFMIWEYDDYLKIKDASKKLYETYCCISDDQEYLDYYTFG